MDIKLSIICATYNHEKYLMDALDGILIQQVDFPVEVLIGEDCSSDNSKEILINYQKLYPGLFNVFYREHNYGPFNNFNDLYKRANGQYIVVLETDDFWFDPLKLKKEVSYLDNHSDVFEVAHNCIMIDKNDDPLMIRYPERRKNRYTFRDYRKGLMPGQTTSIMYRNFYKDNNNEFDLLRNPKYAVGPGDRRRAFIAANNKTVCLPDTMSAYRFIIDGGDSFTANNKQEYKDVEKFYSNILNFAYNYIDNKEAIYSAEFTYFFSMLYYLLKKEKKLTSKEITEKLSSFKYKKEIVASSILRFIEILIKKPFGLNKEYKKYIHDRDVVRYRMLINNKQKYLELPNSLSNTYKKFAIVQGSAN